MAQVRLRSLVDAHLEVDGVAHDIDLGGVDLREHIAVVIVEVADGIVVGCQSFLQELLVVDAALVEREQPRQHVGVVDGVAHPLYVAHIVFLSLVDLYPHVDMLGIDVPHAVAEDDGVAVAQLIVFLDELLLVGLPALGCELLGLEERGELAGLVCLGEGTLSQEATLDLQVGELLVALDGDVAHAHLLLLVDDDVEDDLVFRGHVVALLYLDIGVLESLVVEVFLGQYDGAVDHVGRDLSALEDAELLLHVLLLALLQSDVVDLRHAWPSLERDVQVNLVTYDGVGSDLHVGEQSVVPVALHGVGDGRSWQFDVLSHRQS